MKIRNFSREMSLRRRRNFKRETTHLTAFTSNYLYFWREFEFSQISRHITFS